MMKDEKRKLREEIWGLMEEENIARFPLPAYGRIPNFEGSDIAAEKVTKLEEWKGARTVIANPDFAQRKVRELALRGGKTLIMASPRLRRGYLKIDPEGVKGREDFASTIRGAFRYGKRVRELPKPDLVITGCVAVDGDGNRLGKGGGYGDREIKTIKDKFGDVPVITTVHNCQVVEGVPHEEHDQGVEIIVTPTKVIEV